MNIIRKVEELFDYNIKSNRSEFTNYRSIIARFIVKTFKNFKLFLSIFKNSLVSSLMISILVENIENILKYIFVF